jgi:hypothetical protein
MTTEHVSPSLLLIVPRAEAESCRRLQQTLESAGVRVVLDRRSPERRPLHRVERTVERRTRTEREAALASGKWIVVPAATARVDVLAADARHILFLFCSQHPVPCERCQDTYRLGWFARTEGALWCPRCGDDLTAVVAAHALRCDNWRHRRAQLHGNGRTAASTARIA